MAELVAEMEQLNNSLKETLAALGTSEAEIETIVARSESQSDLGVDVPGTTETKAPEAPPSSEDADGDFADDFSPDGVLLLSAEFMLGEEVSGRYEIDATFSRGVNVDCLDLRASARRLSLPTLPPGVTVPQLMTMLHARLSPEFRADEGVRVGLQTTYMDDSLRILRCTTGKLRGQCSVLVRDV